MTPVKYFVVSRPSKTQEGITREVAHFKTELEATQFENSEYFQNSYGCVGTVDPVSFDIYDSSSEAITNSIQKVVEGALKKLTKKEVVTLGIEHLLEKATPEEAPIPAQVKAAV